MKPLCHILFKSVFASCNSSSGPASQKDDAVQSDDGFVNLFDGKTLDGWEGGTAVWKMVDGVVTGQVTASSTPLKADSFLIWKGGSPADFELKGAYEISAEGNSGIQQQRSRKCTLRAEGIPI